MRRSQILFQQHSGRMFREKWQVQGKKIIYDNGSLRKLKFMGIAFEDANEFIKRSNTPEKELKVIEDDYMPKVVKEDECHPDYHDEPCFKLLNHNVLIGGLDQAKVLTNTYEMDQSSLPVMENISSEPLHEKLVKKCINASLLFDATQKKLPKRTDPERPAFIFPRDYGIPDKKRNTLLGKRLIQLCCSLNPQLFEHRRIIPGPVHFQTCLQRDNKNILLSQNADILITSNLQIEPILNKKESEDMPLPNIYPLSPLISFESHNIYKFEDFFPIKENIEKNHVHTVIAHFNETEVKNLYETDVTESQICARSLMKCYTYAIGQARQTFGKNIIDLPEPLVIQCIQTDSKMFHFSVFQLNTIGTSQDTNQRNVYWNIPIMYLYEQCDYIDAKPQLLRYNPLIFNTLFSFFQNS